MKPRAGVPYRPDLSRTFGNVLRWNAVSLAQQAVLKVWT